jgi:long-chain acyl-CoA synthetase
VPDETPLLATFLDRAASTPDGVALRELRAGGAPADTTLTWGEWARASRAVAAALSAAGHRPGEAVGVLAGNRALWPVADVGALMLGLVSVGLYPTSAPAQVRQILADADATAVIVDTAEQLAKVLAVRGELPRLRTVVCADAPSAGEGVGSWDVLLRHGADVLASDPALGPSLDARARAVRADAVAVLIYTSGSTGAPKGACITHGYLAASAASVRDTLGLTRDDSTLSFLPYCHAGERVFGLYTRILCGIETALVADHARVWEAARRFAPTLFGGLPRFYEKVHEELEAERVTASIGERERWDRVLALGRERSRLVRAGAPVPSELEATWRRLGEPLFARARARFGGRLRLATSGGATLPVEVAEYLDALGVTVLGAYGLTEQLCVAFHRPDHYAFDSVGVPMPGAELRVADDGEILVRRGPLTFAGYLNRPESTCEAFTADGAWLRTGDLGSVDARGALRVVGRKKELIALSTGKKVAPLPIEASLAEDALVERAMLHGEGEKYVTALIWLNRVHAMAWAHARGIALPYEALLAHPELRARVQETVDRANALVSRTEQVRRWALAERELTVEHDELTPTLKLRRPVVAERFGEQLAALYR